MLLTREKRDVLGRNRFGQHVLLDKRSSLTQGLLYCVAPFLGYQPGTRDLVKVRPGLFTELSNGYYGARWAPVWGIDAAGASNAATTDLAFTSGAWTLGLWAWCNNSAGSNSQLFRRGVFTNSASNTGWEVYQLDGQPIAVGSYRNDSNYELACTTVPPDNGACCVVHTSTGSAREIWFNGVSEATSSLNANPLSTAQPLIFGDAQAGSKFAVLLACAWNRALSSREIAYFSDRNRVMDMFRRREALKHISIPWLPLNEYKVGTDSLAVSIAESTTIALTKPATETANVALSESGSQANVTPTASDTLSVLISEAAFNGSTLAGSEELFVVLNDEGISILGVPETDTLNVTITEIAFSGQFFNVNDGIAAVIAETQVRNNAFAFADTLNAAVSESPSFIVPLSDTDTLASEISYSWFLTDIGRQGTDSLAAVVTEAPQTISVTLADVDTVSVRLGEVPSFFSSVPAQSDSLAVSISESEGNSPIRVGLETLNVTISELRTLLKTFYGTDAVNVRLAELPRYLVHNSSSDGIATGITDTGAMTRFLSSPDTLAAAIADVGTVLVVLSYRTGHDVLRVSLDELTAISSSRAGNDSLAAAIAESGGTLTSLVGADSLSVAVGEVPLAGTTQLASDTLSAAISEATSQLVMLSASEMLKVRFSHETPVRVVTGGPFDDHFNADIVVGLLTATVITEPFYASTIEVSGPKVRR